ncbi:MAG: type IV toxin-antitoxin system AbiEi family antitoxin domain-containing protein [Chloroflexi bacterium]|nr:type IV toxin-antitoxin system AbiEi family antitoxin domain-containing protein [Chloroflexota bacterium]
MELAPTYRRRLREVAHDQHGYITTRDARRLGVPEFALRQLAAYGGLDHVARGVYRFDDFAVTPTSQSMEAVLRAGDGAHLIGDAVLALHGLALVNPDRIRVGVPRRVRASLPPTIRVERRSDSGDLTSYEGIPATTVARAIIDSIGVVPRERLRAAITAARERGLLLERERAAALAALDDGP